MAKTEFAGKSAQELQGLLKEMQAELYSLRRKTQLRGLSDVRSIREVRQKIAQAQTELAKATT